MITVAVLGNPERAIQRLIERVSTPVELRRWAHNLAEQLKAASRSRTLRRFIRWRILGSIIRVEADHPLGMWMEYGTGLYGPQRRRIVPTRMKVLRWVQNGRVRYAPSTRGMRKRPFFWRTVARAQREGVFGR